MTAAIDKKYEEGILANIPLGAFQCRAATPDHAAPSEARLHALTLAAPSCACAAEAPP